MYIGKFSKNGRVYYGFFSRAEEYVDESSIPDFIKNGELTDSD